MLGKILKAILAILFVPLVISCTKAFFISLDGISVLNVNLFLLAAGFAAYPIFHIVFFKPMYLYALGHEVVHVLAAWICGGKIISFQVSQSGGSVTTTKTNLFITLSPYFVPIHTIVLFFIFWVLSRFLNIARYSSELIFLIGFTMSFHIFMTIEVMKMRQPDIVKIGHVFSILFIYIANVSITLLVLSFIFGDISFVSYARKSVFLAGDIYLRIFRALT
tara:strand:+ start:201 stop:860 length:660 start_codon:yes stop_codon:yes gene_type:complete